MSWRPFAGIMEVAAVAMEHGFGLNSALQASRQGQIGGWVQAYLRTGSWANLGLADGLLLDQRWWLGPFEAPLESFARKCGPETGMEYVDPVEKWNRSVEVIASSLFNLDDLPPLIVERRAGRWLIADGNHRHEALRRRGYRSCWALAWLNSPDDLAECRAFV